MKALVLIALLVEVAACGLALGPIKEGSKRPNSAGEDLKTSSRPRTIVFKGSVRREETFSRPLADHLTFVLVPISGGWQIDVQDDRLKLGLTRLTPPFHGPNPTSIEGWHFRNADNSGLNTGELNVPQKVREFIFSSEFERAIENGDESYWTSPEQVCKAAGDGFGRITITQLRLGNLVRGQQAWVEEMRFRVKIEMGKTNHPYAGLCKK